MITSSCGFWEPLGQGPFTEAIEQWQAAWDQMSPEEQQETQQAAQAAGVPLPEMVTGRVGTSPVAKIALIAGAGLLALMLFKK